MNVLLVIAGRSAAPCINLKMLTGILKSLNTSLLVGSLLHFNNSHLFSDFDRFNNNLKLLDEALRFAETVTLQVTVAADGEHLKC